MFFYFGVEPLIESEAMFMLISCSGILFLFPSSCNMTGLGLCSPWVLQEDMQMHLPRSSLNLNHNPGLVFRLVEHNPVKNSFF